MFNYLILSKMLKKLFILIFVFSQAFVAFSQDKKEIDFESYDITKVGQKVPDISFQTLSGKSYKISELEGKTILLVFFATWCSGCQKEMPLIETEIWKKYKSDDFMIIAFGRDHSMAEMEKYQKEKGFTFQLAPDPEHKIFEKFFKSYIPRTVLVNEEGKIIYQKQGYNEEDAKKLKELIELQKH